MVENGVSNVNDLVDILSAGISPASDSNDLSEILSRLDKIEALEELNRADLLSQKKQIGELSTAIDKAMGY